MNLEEYFAHRTGTGVLATSDAEGNVNGALYARPHVLESDRVAFIMADRLSHANLQSNGKAAFIFRSDEEGYTGVRLYLTKLDETSDEAAVEELLGDACRHGSPRSKGTRYRVEFRVDRVRALVGDKEL